jgi:HAD superfamily hydrolase (TIGR01484 family)
MQPLKNKRPAVVIFSDLDGTLLNEKYDYAAVQNIIDKLLSRHSCLVLSSSKTYAEIEHYRNKLNIQDPFICENGAAIFVPKATLTTANSIGKPTQRGTELGVHMPSCVNN